jgi:D-arginine dehydrogenase
MREEQAFDFIVLGAGMAGASIAAELAAPARVLLIEMEDQPGRHTTGRSAAMFFESYGNPVVRALTRASRTFLLQPPADISATALMHRRDALIVATEESLPRLDAMEQAMGSEACLRRVTAPQALARCPILRPDRIVAALVDDSGHDIDVAGLHQGWLRRLRQRGGVLVLDAGPAVLERGGPGWSVRARQGVWHAPVVINATGAWADEVAAQAGAPRIGLQPKRRTAVMLPAPEGHDIRGWPLVSDVDETCYFKPDAGQLMLSPANEDDSPACDAAPEELEIALAAHRFEEMTTVPVRRITHRWAGLRTFAPDRSPVVGFDADVAGLFWFAGQGGYGIQMAPAMARVGAALALGQALPDDIAVEGVDAAALSPKRLRGL